MEKTNILIVDDHISVRVGIKHMLKNIITSVNIEQAANFKVAMKFLETTNPYDLIILDINIPGGEAPSMITKIKEIQKDTRILIFSGYDEHIYALPYLQAGANGYLSKNSSEEEFSMAVKSILNKNTYVSTHLQQQLLSNMLNVNENSSKNPIAKLSGREMEVMQLMLKGLGTAEIGAKIHLQLSTISTYKMKIFEKMQVKNLVELISKTKHYQSGN